MTDEPSGSTVSLSARYSGEEARALDFVASALKIPRSRLIREYPIKDVVRKAEAILRDPEREGP